MKVAILAGGYGTRISEESHLKPKPMIEIGGKPILWHIMKHYSSYGHTEFVVLLGYMGYYIKEYFSNYFLHQSDVTIHTANNKMEIHNTDSEDWKITLVDTGLNTMTGGRLMRARKYLENDTFMLTYGDGVSDVNVDKLVSFHREHKRIISMTAIQPEGKFGALEIKSNSSITSFKEKPKGDGAWINGGFFVCNPKIFNYIKEGDQTILERNPLETLASEGELFAYKHSGFWQCMDTIRDKTQLTELWEKGKAPWKTWK